MFKKKLKLSKFEERHLAYSNKWSAISKTNCLATGFWGYSTKQIDKNKYNY